MQVRVLWQLEEAGIAVEVFFVMMLQEARARELSIGQSDKTAWGMQRETERIATQDAIANVKTNEREQVGRGGGELTGRAVVAAPVEAEMSGKNAAPRDGRNVGHFRQDSGIAEETDQAEMIERRSKATSRKCETDLHGSACTGAAWLSASYRRDPDGLS